MTSVDLWHVRTDAVTDAKTIQTCMRVMAKTERERHARFVFERHRHEYLVTRGLVRAVLSTYVNRPPGELTFTISDHGRPSLDNSTAGLRFNVTNTTELVACIVGRDDREVGVDAEPLTRGDEILGIEATVFTSAERASLARLAISERRRRAVELWTLKEAYMKARGLGLSLPPDTIELAPRGGIDADAPEVRIVRPNEDESEKWVFTTLEIDEHLVSTCISRRNSGGDGDGDGDDGPIPHDVRRADLNRMLASA